MKPIFTVLVLLAGGLVATSASFGQDRFERRSENRPLTSLRASAAETRAQGPQFIDQIYNVPNKPLREDLRTQQSSLQVADPILQEATFSGSTSTLASFDGASNADNASVLGFQVSPPDTDGDVGPNHYVQMINLVTTVFNKNGSIAPGGQPFGSNAFWTGIGGLCEPYNQGDPIVIYDETNDRWLVSQFAFNDAFTEFAQCVAISQSGDPLGAYNRYEFDFGNIGFPDYPKHGITSESITMMANIFKPRGPFNFQFTGTFIGAMDKDAMYAGSSATLVGFSLGSNEFGFVAGDLDDPAGTAGFVPALFATAMSNASQFDVWEIDIDWANPNGASANQIAAIPISPFDTDLCSASREACIPQPGTSQRLEALSDRLMHRLQIRDFGTHRSMLTSHTVDVGSGRAGVRWYEMRDSGSGWSLYQEGTFAPADGLNRWVPSIAMNAAGDIGVGYLVSNGTDTHLSVGVSGQSASFSGTGLLDGAESICRAGSGAQTGSARAGDYSATNVDPATDTFWHTNEYVAVSGQVAWKTSVCEFSVTPGAGGTPPIAPSNLAASAVSSSAIDLSWTDNASDEDSFEIERSLDNVSFSQVGTAAANATSFSDNGLAASTTYFYRVRACNLNGCSAYSNTADATTQGGGGAPTDVHVASILTGTQNAGKGFKKGTATIAIANDLGQPVETVYSVTGVFTGSYNETVTASTDGSGTAFLVTQGEVKGGVSVMVCVDAVDGALPYDPADNADPAYDCGLSAPSKRDRGVVAERLSDVPASFRLDQNYPNPFNPATRISFSIAEPGMVRLSVYNLLGQEVANLVDGYHDAGSYQIGFDAAHLSGGVYLYILETGTYTATRMMTLLK